ncbi:CDP-glucose 4,6-dehydratase [Paenibacillus sp. LHD-38]|uniref:CDP-glucose 4,6-dehydratase n=1 Tax=Paenibacillus sp. LHD-38 TaxID=3072143 RepID=UPI00280D7D49|nr:CDP-glucose 4,6-dehydratase [Paenibacillus sp. LHD-38]MDQ8738623.1 CDP-glucose 4,6-dehydratase [Paenibacillus sp. LHD-38]
MRPAFWQGKRVFLTGHTGFKGAWLSIWLSYLGAEVHGYSLRPPTKPSLYELAQVETRLAGVIYDDIRNLDALRSVILNARPDIIIHMAAQPLVRKSYLEPLETYQINVMGTVHLFEAIRSAIAADHSIKAVINVTTDKCYENKDWEWGYRETDSLGGNDPYSNSKACSETITNAYRTSYFSGAAGCAVATARAGNVIGGGDWANDRLVPDCLDAIMKGKPISLRNPSFVRPWQHVCEPLGGYLQLAEKMYDEGHSYEGAWNFGPDESDFHSVEGVTSLLCSKWGDSAAYRYEFGEQQAKESPMLRLDSSKAKHRLGWKPKWTISQSLDKVVDWTQSWIRDGDAAGITISQIKAYMEG